MERGSNNTPQGSSNPNQNVWGCPQPPQPNPCQNFPQMSSADVQRGLEATGAILKGVSDILTSLANLTPKK
uniref:Uncharacterized protein n=1 Tax=Lutzomyia longipalpis TaxID=7200 RepID=A0A1B0CAJ7_LUTLO